MGVTTWTAAEDDLIVDGIAKGLTWQGIAETMPGRTARTARLRADRMGIRPVRKELDEGICPIDASRELLDRLEASFTNAARKWGVDYLDARTLLMNASGL